MYHLYAQRHWYQRAVQTLVLHRSTPYPCSRRPVYQFILSTFGSSVVARFKSILRSFRHCSSVQPLFVTRDLHASLGHAGTCTKLVAFDSPKRFIYTPKSSRACVFDFRARSAEANARFFGFSKKIVVSKILGAASVRRSVPCSAEPGNQIKAA